MKPLIGNKWSIFQNQKWNNMLVKIAMQCREFFENTVLKFLRDCISKWKIDNTNSRMWVGWTIEFHKIWFQFTKKLDTGRYSQIHNFYMSCFISNFFLSGYKIYKCTPNLLSHATFLQFKVILCIRFENIKTFVKDKSNRFLKFMEYIAAWLFRKSMVVVGMPLYM